MVDAEHTYFQPAIDHLVLSLQRQYNKERPSIFNTYQCYLCDAHRRISEDLERSRRDGTWFCVKVRDFVLQCLLCFQKNQYGGDARSWLTPPPPLIYPPSPAGARRVHGPGARPRCGKGL